MNGYEYDWIMEYTSTHGKSFFGVNIDYPYQIKAINLAN